MSYKLGLYTLLLIRQLLERHRTVPDRTGTAPYRTPQIQDYHLLISIIKDYTHILPYEHTDSTSLRLYDTICCGKAAKRSLPAELRRSP